MLLDVFGGGVIEVFDFLLVIDGLLNVWLLVYLIFLVVFDE